MDRQAALDDLIEMLVDELLEREAKKNAVESGEDDRRRLRTTNDGDHSTSSRAQLSTER